MPREHADASTAGDTHPEGSWACLGCGNINWPKRTTCNKKSCRLPRAGLGAGSMGQMGMGGVGGMGNGGMSGHPPGSWPCPMCHNVNWPQRDTCNTKGCTATRPANASAMGGMGGMGMHDPMMGYGGGGGYGAGGDPSAFNAYSAYGGMDGMGGGMGGMGPYGGMGGMGGMSQFPTPAAAGGANPPGSWACPGCHNVNWPKRTTCNTKGCEQPRPVDAGGVGQHPAGSWACPTCQNMNWPKRTTCNKSGCATPRPM